MMGALADHYGSFDAVFYTTAMFGAVATTSAFLLHLLKKREKAAAADNAATEATD